MAKVHRSALLIGAIMYNSESVREKNSESRWPLVDGFSIVRVLWTDALGSSRKIKSLRVGELPEIV